MARNSTWQNAGKEMTMSFLLRILALGLLAGLPGVAAEAADVVSLQKFKKEFNLTLGKNGSYRFVVLNQHYEKWYFLEIRQPGQAVTKKYHLENPWPDEQLVRPGEEAGTLKIVSFRQKQICVLDGKTGGALQRGAASGKPWVYLCNKRLLLRNQMDGEASVKEQAVEFLRDNIWNGEKVISSVKDTVYKDKELIRSKLRKGRRDRQVAGKRGPAEARMKKKYYRARMAKGELGIDVQGPADGFLNPGRWYASRNTPGVFASVYQPSFTRGSIMRSWKSRVLPMDNVENTAAVYLVAFEMDQFDIAYALGTDHPRVSYSERTPARHRVAGWQGPDSIGDYQPLASPGMVNPVDAERVVASFTGGFKRKHSVFRWGPYARRKGGTHYGFMQDGVVFSTLQEGLATAILTKSGGFELKTWNKNDNERLGEIRFARQNGLPLIDYDPVRRKSLPGKYVGNNRKGNWSGSKQNTIRALRTGLCMQTRNGKKYAIYGYFSSHTPNAMARVFQAYNCDYAIHLDMNMIVHTYLATYHRDENSGDLAMEHVVEKMHWKDASVNGKKVPRFVGVPDNRDFFYMMRKRTPEQRYLVGEPPLREKPSDGVALSEKEHPDKAVGSSL